MIKLLEWLETNISPNASIKNKFPLGSMCVKQFILEVFVGELLGISEDDSEDDKRVSLWDVWQQPATEMEIRKLHLTSMELSHQKQLGLRVKNSQPLAMSHVSSHQKAYMGSRMPWFMLNLRWGPKWDLVRLHFPSSVRWDWVVRRPVGPTQGRAYTTPKQCLFQEGEVRKLITL